MQSTNEDGANVLHANYDVTTDVNSPKGMTS